MATHTMASIIGPAHIKGFCDRVLFRFVDGKVECKFISDDMIVMGVLVCEQYSFDEFLPPGKVIAIPNIDAFLKAIAVLGDDININIENDTGHDVMVLSDGTIKIKHTLITESQFPVVPDIKGAAFSHTPIQLDIGKGFIDNFYKLSGTIKDAKYLFVETSGDGTSLMIHISQNEDFSSGYSLEYDVEIGNTIELYKFDLKKLRLILNGNKKANGGILKFHDTGLLNVMFDWGELVVNYYLVSED